jgi:trimeric autotransporter adhesin
MSNQPTPGVFIELAYNSNAFFTDSQKGDVCIRTANSNQKLLFGVTKDAPAMLGMDSSNIILKGNIAIGGASNPSEVLDVRNGNAYFDSNIYVMNQLSVGSTQPTESLDVVNGNAKLNSNLYVINQASIGISDSNPTETLDVGSNLKVRSNAYVMYRVAVGKSNPDEVVDIQGNTKISNNLYALQNLSVGTSNPRESVDILTNTIIRSNAYVMRRMSIGSSNPTEILDVTGNEKITGRLFVSSNIGAGTSNPTERLDVYDNTKLRGDLYALNKIVVGQSSSNPNETLDVRGNTKIGVNLYVMSNVSFGSSNPSEKLDVLGNTKVQGNLYTTTRISVGNSNPTERIDVSGNILASSNIYAMQNVGIGTVFPTEKLDVTGNAKVLNNLYVVQKIGVGNSNPEEKVHISGGNAKVSSNLYVLNRMSINSSNPSVGLEVNTTDAVLLSKGTTAQRPSVPVLGQVRYNTDNSQFEGFGAGSAWTSLTGVKSTDLQTYISAEEYPTSNDGIIRFYNSNIENMRITPEGNVGIGVPNSLNSLDYKLDVDGWYRFTDQRISNVRKSISMWSDDLNTSFEQDFYIESNGEAYLSVVGLDPLPNPSFYMFNNEAIPMYFGTDGKSRLYISETGSVGIGIEDVITPSIRPSEKFEVTGNTKISSNVYVLSRLGVNTSNPSETTDIIGNLKVSSNIYTSNAIVIGGASNPTEKLVLVGNAKMSSNLYVLSNIAIAHSNPTEKLDILGNLKVSSNIYTSNAIVIGGRSNPTEKLDLIGNAKMSSNLYVLSNVAIAHSNPTEKLDILGNLKISSNIYTSNAIVIGGASNPSEKLDLVGNAKMSSNLYVLGNIAIAHSNPTEKLDILGNLKVSSNIYTSNAIVIGGASNPTEKLDLVGNAKMSSNLYVLSNVAIAHSNPTEKLDILGNLKVSSNIYTSNAIVIGGRSNPTEKLDLVGNAKMSSNLYVLSNVAIAHSNPTEKLDILGNLKISSNIYTSNAIVIGGASNPSEKLDLVGNAKMSSNLYVLSNVAIAHSNPTEKLDIFGNLKVSSNIYTSNAIVIGGASNPSEKLDLVGNAKMSSNLYVLSNVAIAHSNPTEKLDILGNLKVSSNIYTSNAIVIGGASNPSEKLDLVGNAKMSSNLYVLSNIAIGHSNPTEKLDILGNLKVSSNIYTSNAIVIGGASNPSEKLDLVGNAKMSSNLYVLSNVAIGHSNPTEKLDILGNLKVSSNIYTSNAIVIGGRSNPTEKLDLVGNAKMSSNLYVLSNIAIAHSNPTEKLDILGNLKVSSNIYTSNAIVIGGASNPTEKLDLVGNAKVTSNLYVLNRLSINSSNPAVGLEVNTTDAVLLSKGTSAQRPSVPILGHIRYNTDNSQFEGFGAGSSWGSLGGVKSTNQQTYITAEEYPTSNDDVIRFYNSNIESMRITRQRLVGIGITTPTEKLDLIGNVKISSNEYIMGSLGVNTSNITEKLQVISGKIYSDTQVIASSNDTPAVPAFSFKENSNTGMFHASNDAIGFTTSGTEKMRIDTYGNIGIGKSNPSYKLDVSGSVYALGYCNLMLDSYTSTSTSNAPTANALKFAADAAIYTSNMIFLTGGSGGASLASMSLAASNTAYWSSNNLVNKNGDTMVGTLVTPYIGVNTSVPSERVDITGNLKVSSNIYVANRIGVNTSNPSQAIHVVGNMRLEGNLDVNGIFNTINTDVQLTDQFTISNNGTGPALKVYQIGAQPVADFYDDTTLALRIADGGNVGIGTNNPGYKLDVNGVIRVANGILMNQNDDTYIGISATNSAPALGLIKRFASLPCFAFTSNYGNSTSANAMYFGMLSGSNLAAVGTCNLTTYMTLDNAGNLGIGTTTPAYKLDVVGDVRAQNNGCLMSGTTLGFLRMVGVSSGTYIQSGLSNYNNSAAPLVFGTINNATEWARFDNTGNLGLGTNAPAYKLDVSGNVNIGSASTDYSITSTGQLSLWANRTGSASYIHMFYAVGSNNSSVGDHVWYTRGNYSSGTERMRILSGGNIGIGTSTPAYKLDVQGGTVGLTNTGAKKLQFGNDLTTNRHIVLFEAANDEHQFYGLGINTNMLRYQVSGSSANHVFYVGTSSSTSTELMRVQGNGNVGIGTASPSCLLHVSSNIANTGTTIVVENPNTGTAGWASFTVRNSGSTGNSGMRMGMLGTGWTNNGHWLQNGGFLECDTSNGISVAATSNNGSIRLYAGGTTEVMRVNSNQNVGIGTTSPAYKLDVNGVVNIKAGGFQMIEADNTYLGVNAAGYASSLGIVKKMGSSPSFAFTSNAGGLNTANAMYFGMLAGSNLAAVSDCNLTTMMTLANSGNLGIGTTTPAYKLDVNGTVNASSYVGATITSLSNLALYGSNTSLSASNVAYWSSNNLVNKTGGDMTNYLQVSSNSSFARIGSSASVGMYLSLNQGQNMWIPESNWPTYGIGSSPTGTLGISGFYGIAFATQGAHNMTIASGNVGIGTTTPSTKLDVNGMINIAGTDWGSGLMFSNADERILRTTSASYPGLVANINPSSNFSVVSTGANVRLLVQGSTGNVGIGTTSPSYPLQVNGTIHSTSNVYVNNGQIGTPTTATLGGVGDRFILYPGTGSVHPYSMGIGTGTMWRSVPTGSQHQWYIGGTVGMTLSNNNLGIGTTSPVARLEVNGNILMSSNDSYIGLTTGGNGPSLGMIKKSGVPPTFAFTSNYINGTIGNAMRFVMVPGFSLSNMATNTPTEFMTLTNSGNLGINNISPVEILDVVGNIRASSNVYVGSTYGSNYLGLGNGDNATLCNYNVKLASWWGIGFPCTSDNINRVIMDTRNGNIATMGKLVVGASNISTFQLDVQGGTVGITNAGTKKLQFPNDATTNRHIVLFEAANNEHQYFGFGINTSILRYQVDQVGSAHVFYAGTSLTASTELMRIQGNGNVGIGTGSPSSALHVVGKVIITSNAQLYYEPILDVKYIDNTQGIGIGYSTILATGSLTNQDININPKGSGDIKINTSTGYLKVNKGGSVVAIGASNNAGGGFCSVGNGTEMFNASSNWPMYGMGASPAGKVNIQGYYELSLGTDANTLMTLSRVGAIGIGTTTPSSSYKLDVSGNLNATTVYQNGTTLNTVITNALASYLPLTSGTLTNALTITETTGSVGGATSGTLTLKHNNSGGSSSIVFTSTVNAGSDYAYIKYNDHDVSTYFPAQTGVSECSRLTIGIENDVDTNAGETILIKGGYGIAYDSQRHYFATGNVGIGTSAPSAPLHITPGVGTDPNNNGIFVYNPTNGTTSNAIIGARVAGGSGGNPYYSWDIAGVTGWSMGVSNADSDKLVIKTNWNFAGDNNVMTILTGGNVGIGTTSPAAKFHVHASGTISYIRVSGDVAQQQGIEFVDTATRWIMYKPANSTNLTFYDGAGDRMTLQYGGNVGIGTTSPSYKLDVNGTIKGINYILPNDAWITTADAKNRLYFGASGRSYYRGEDGHEWRSSTDGFLMVLTNGGNLGIGTSSPGAYKLNVSGDVYATGDITAFSDISAKSNLEQIKNPLDKIQQINGYTYDFRTAEVSQTKITDRYSGLIAQEVQQILPEVIHKSADGKLSIAYGNMAGLFVESIKELKKENNELKLENQTLKTKVTDIEDKLARLESIINTLQISK